jgi:membrane protease YdiL (CAAX protease family)
MLVAWMCLLPRPFEAAPARLLGLDASRVLLPATLLSLAGWWSLAGFVSVPWRRGALYLPPAVFPLMLLVGSAGALGTTGPVGLIIVTDLAVAFGEESVFRGLVLRALRPSGALRAAIVSSLLFGAIHSVNLLGGMSPVYVLLQMVWTTLLGFALAATVLATRNIWPAIAIHFAIDLLNDLAPTTQAGSGQAATMLAGIATIVAFAALAAYGWRLLRRLEARPADRLDSRVASALRWTKVFTSARRGSAGPVTAPAPVRLAARPVAARTASPACGYRYSSGPSGWPGGWS